MLGEVAFAAASASVDAAAARNPNVVRRMRKTSLQGLEHHNKQIATERKSCAPSTYGVVWQMPLRSLETKARLQRPKLILGRSADLREQTIWGKHLIIDMSASDRGRVQSAENISRFVETLVETIGMKAYGAPVLEHFAEHLPEAAGYSLVQLIETSAITGHFCDLSSEAYIDIFSCKGFQAELAVEVIRAAFRPQHINFITLLRQAVKPRASYMLAAEYVLAAD